MSSRFAKSEELDFESYLGDLIVTMADRQAGPRLRSHDIKILHRATASQAPPTWAELAPDEMERRGWIRRTTGTVGAPYLELTGTGLNAAHEIRRERRPKSVWDWLKGFSRSDWISFGAFIVSIVALLKD